MIDDLGNETVYEYFVQSYCLHCISDDLKGIDLNFVLVAKSPDPRSMYAPRRTCPQLRIISPQHSLWRTQVAISSTNEEKVVG